MVCQTCKDERKVDDLPAIIMATGSATKQKSSINPTPADEKGKKEGSQFSVNAKQPALLQTFATQPPLHYYTPYQQQTSGFSTVLPATQHKPV